MLANLSPFIVSHPWGAVQPSSPTPAPKKRDDPAQAVVSTRPYRPEQAGARLGCSGTVWRHMTKPRSPSGRGARASRAVPAPLCVVADASTRPNGQASWGAESEQPDRERRRSGRSPLGGWGQWDCGTRPLNALWRRDICRSTRCPGAPHSSRGDMLPPSTPPSIDPLRREAVATEGGGGGRIRAQCAAIQHARFVASSRNVVKKNFWSDRHWFLALGPPDPSGGTSAGMTRQQAASIGELVQDRTRLPLEPMRFFSTSC
jgi:hypothetical protein